MAKTKKNEHINDGQGRLDNAEKSSGETVGQMTASDRRLWAERAASFDEHSDPGERSRREAARKKSQVKTKATPGQDASEV